MLVVQPLDVRVFPEQQLQPSDVPSETPRAKQRGRRSTSTHSDGSHTDGRVISDADGRLARGRAAQLLGRVDEGLGAESPMFSEADVKAKLEDGRAQGKRLYRLIQRPTLLGGTTVLLVSIVMVVMLFDTVYASIPGLLATPMALVHLLALMPTDRKAIFAVCITMSSAATVVLVLFAVTLVERIDTYRSLRASDSCYAPRDGGQVAALCDYAISTIASAALYCASAAHTCARLANGMRARHPARMMLLELWHTWGMTMLALCACNIVTLVASLATNTWMTDMEHLTHVGVIAEQLLFGVLALRADFRLGAQSWLASRGEAVTTAASIAALIGSRSIEDVQQLALQRLRAIRLDLISFDELTSPRPDPALYGKSSRCQLGQIDAFISHRCAVCTLSRLAFRLRLCAAVPPPLLSRALAPRAGRERSARAERARRLAGNAASRGARPVVVM